MMSLTSSRVMSVSLVPAYALAIVSSSAGDSCPCAASWSIFASASCRLPTCAAFAETS